VGAPFAADGKRAGFSRSSTADLDMSAFAPEEVRKPELHVKFVWPARTRRFQNKDAIRLTVPAHVVISLSVLACRDQRQITCRSKHRWGLTWSLSGGGACICSMVFERRDVSCVDSTLTPTLGGGAARTTNYSSWVGNGWWLLRPCREDFES